MGQLVSVGALVLLFIGLLLPWLSGVVDFLGSESENGFHGWGWLSFVALLVGIAVLVTRALVRAGQIPGLVPTVNDIFSGRVLAVAGGAAVLGTVLFWVTATTGSNAYASVGISGGLIVSLIAGLSLIAGGALLASPGLAASMSSRRTGTGSG